MRVIGGTHPAGVACASPNVAGVFVIRALLPLCLLLTVASASAQVQRSRPEIPLTPAQERQYRALLPQLRCLVCQDESLSDSQAPLAGDLRYEVRGLVARGRSDVQVKRYLVQRYGDFVLFKPPFKPSTWLLWAGPFLIAAVALSTVAVYLRRRVRRPLPDAAVDPESLRRLLDQER
ncbi:MAG: cytochrome c-type biogenesis protein CcmH [Gammaproteobacteria bacterium]|nr:cytochrome c-type biogenesis protein CcmH [Gammaproteobacteria bacterium]